MLENQFIFDALVPYVDVGWKKCNYTENAKFAMSLKLQWKHLEKYVDKEKTLKVYCEKYRLTLGF